MPRRVLDTNVLLRLWRGSFNREGRVATAVVARDRPREWLKKHPNDALVTPVVLEVLAGVDDKDELRLTDLFLSQFKVLDAGQILDADWAEALRRARRVPFNGRKRDAIDCLIDAICDRLHAELVTFDTGFPRK